MLPTDISCQNFAEMRSHLGECRERIYRAWLRFGPCTTKELSGLSGENLLTLRPRTTELLQVGALELVGADGANGIYTARRLDAWERFFNEQKLTAKSQLSLNL